MLHVSVENVLMFYNVWKKSSKGKQMSLLIKWKQLNHVTRRDWKKYKYNDEITNCDINTYWCLIAFILMQRRIKREIR